MSIPLLPILTVGAIYSGSERGLIADAAAARSIGAMPYSVCTAIVAASHDAVTDLTEVPVDTVFSQLEHLGRVISPKAIRIGILGSDRNAKAVLDWASGAECPVVLELVASGPSGETVLPARGIDVVAEHLNVADVVILSRQDAELVTGGEITSLDDAQVAAQRIVNRGARSTVINCGMLPARFYDPADDPGDGKEKMSSYLFFDGEDFALFELPLSLSLVGLESIFAITVCVELARGSSMEEALQAATREVAESTRHASDVEGDRRVATSHWRHVAPEATA